MTWHRDMRDIRFFINACDEVTYERPDPAKNNTTMPSKLLPQRATMGTVPSLKQIQRTKLYVKNPLQAWAQTKQKG